jgi:hypothetical protein
MVPGSSVTITQGHKVSLSVIKAKSLLRLTDRPLNGNQNGFYKHGFSLELRDWLIDRVGETCAHHAWEDGHGDWLHTGSRWSSTHQQKATLWIDFWIRDLRKAVLFKLRWHGAQLL